LICLQHVLKFKDSSPAQRDRLPSVFDLYAQQRVDLFIAAVPISVAGPVLRKRRSTVIDISFGLPSGAIFCSPTNV
jgi:hypothetical protein